MEYGIKKITLCLECGDEIEYGRQDRKFCCNACKNKYHNRKLRDTRYAKTRILNTLEKNYSILERILKQDHVDLSISELKYMGFNFDYLTSYQKTRRHDEYGCFDIHFTVMSSKIISIGRVKPLRKWD